jgi:hypothetical protein
LSRHFFKDNYFKETSFKKMLADFVFNNFPLENKTKHQQKDALELTLYL